LIAVIYVSYHFEDSCLAIELVESKDSCLANL